VEISASIASICKTIIETVQDYPKDLRFIFIETGSLRAIFKSLTFLKEDNATDSATLQQLVALDGPVAGCKAAIDQLAQLFPPRSSAASKPKGGKRHKLHITTASLT